MKKWFRVRSEAPPLETVRKPAACLSPSKPRVQYMKSPAKRFGRTTPEKSPIASRIESPNKRVHKSPNPHCKKVFSPNKRRKFCFNRRRKMSIEHDDEPLLFIKFALSMPRTTYRGRKLLPPRCSGQSQRRGTLVLDLDETLVHCCTSPLPRPDVVFPVEYGGSKFDVYGKFRPYMRSFLRHVAQSWEIVVFTASQSVYANKILDILDEDGVISYRLFRSACTNAHGNFIKDLKCLGRDLRKTVIVDNSPQCFTFQIRNGIPITSWYDDEDDDELERLQKLLDEIKDQPDYRECLTKEFNLECKISDLEHEVYQEYLGL